MSFGFSVGDFVAVGQVVLRLYNACQNAPKEFQEISGELSSIHTVLFGLSEQAKDPTSLLLQRGGDRGLEWTRIRENLETTLAELQDLVKRYETMGRNAWRRARLGMENLTALRSKFGFHLAVINTFVSSLSLSALGRMEPVLGRIECLLRESVREERAGHKTPTVLTAHETGDEVSWKQIEMDLLLEGIPREDYERNRDRIRELLKWIVTDENELANLRGVEPDDSISCFATEANPFEDQVFELQPSGLSVFDEIFHPLPSPAGESDAYLDAIHETGGPSSPSKLHPALVNEVFGPSLFDQEAEKAFHQTPAPATLKEKLDDVWKSLDSKSDHETIMASKVSTPTSSFGPRRRRTHPRNANRGMRRDDARINHIMNINIDAMAEYPTTLNEDEHTSDSESMTGPHIFWRGSEWSGEEHDNYVQISDWESEDSDAGTIEVELTLGQDEDTDKDGVFIENGSYEDEEERMRSAGWQRLEG